MALGVYLDTAAADKLLVAEPETTAQAADATLRSIDALHLVGALRLSANAILTYDARLVGAAEARGIAVLSPGASLALRIASGE